MTADQIEDMVGLLPENAPYVTRIPRFLNKDMGVPEEVDIRAHAMNDAAFGWMFLKSFLDLGRPLPVMVLDPLLTRPYCYLRYRMYDRNARMAVELENHANRTKRVLLRCMLLVKEIEYAKIGALLKLPEDTVQIYESLFWNVKDRLDDKAYITQLIFPDTRKVELMPTYFVNEDPYAIVLRAVFHHGMQAVEEYLGMRNPIMEFDGQNHAKSYEARILSAGNFLAKMGYLHQYHAYGISSARHVLQSIKMSGEDHVDDDARRGLEGMSLGRSMAETFMEIVRPDVEYQLELQNMSLD